MTVFFFSGLFRYEVWVIRLCGARDHDEQRKEGFGSFAHFYLVQLVRSAQCAKSFKVSLPLTSFLPEIHNGGRLVLIRCDAVHAH